MSQKSIPGNRDLGQAIKSRRIDLSLTIEEAAKRAGVGIKTWCRYESGESIRQDKAKSVCKALNWRALPSSDSSNDPPVDFNELRANEYWSSNLEENYGAVAAASFVIGSEILEDHINEDLSELSHKPQASHIGELSVSFLADILPEQFLTRYDYEFLYALRCALLRLKQCAKSNADIIAHSVIEELVLYLIVEESHMLLDDINIYPEDNWDTWVFDAFGDDDIITFLYSDIYLTEDNNYHFNNWMYEQFYTE